GSNTGESTATWLSRRASSSCRRGARPPLVVAHALLVLVLAAAGPPLLDALSLGAAPPHAHRVGDVPPLSPAADPRAPLPHSSQLLRPHAGIRGTGRPILPCPCRRPDTLVAHVASSRP